MDKHCDGWMDWFIDDVDHVCISVVVVAAIVGKRKFDGGHQNQGESKRRYQSNWGSQPLAQQPLGAAGVNGDQQQWYQDSYQTWS